MSEELAFRCTLPLPPSVNDWLVPMLSPMPDGPGARKLIAVRMAVRGKDGKVWRAGVVKSTDAKKWLKDAREKLTLMRRPMGLHRGVLEVVMRVFVPSLSSDGGNRLKLPEDAFKALVIDDDRQFVVWHITKDIDSENPRVELEVRKADPLLHPRVAERLARAEKERARKDAKSSVNQLALPVAPARAPSPPAPPPARSARSARTPPVGTEPWKTPLPPSSRAGTPSYGSQHAAEFGTRKPKVDPKSLATSASYPPGKSR